MEIQEKTAVMPERKKTRTAAIGSVKIGSRHPVVIQSMTKTNTVDVDGTLRQIRRLAAAGCGLVRIAVPTKADTAAFGRIAARSPLPLVADIHFSPQRAVEAIEAGAAKIRLNPGNIKKQEDIGRIIDCAKQHGTAIRIGVNEASIRDLKQDVAAGLRVSLMLKEITGYVRLFEKAGFENLVLSAKSADTIRTIGINRAISERFDYPVHIGLTHAGLAEDALVPSAVAIGTLLAEGIGDTVRVSMAAEPVQEIEAAKKILGTLGLYQDARPQLVVCPTCGRCQGDVVKLAGQVRKLLTKIDKPIRVAVMGCVVNGPGEAADADIAVCAGTGKGFIYRKGRKTAVAAEKDLPNAVKKELQRL